jgi:hypothetical protein
MGLPFTSEYIFHRCTISNDLRSLVVIISRRCPSTLLLLYPTVSYVVMIIDNNLPRMSASDVLAASYCFSNRDFLSFGCRDGERDGAGLVWADDPVRAHFLAIKSRDWWIRSRGGLIQKRGMILKMSHSTAVFKHLVTKEIGERLQASLDQISETDLQICD